MLSNENIAYIVEWKFNLCVIENEFIEIIVTDTINAENKSSKIAAGPKCKWYQWGCVFYMSSAQLPVLVGIWYINLGTGLELLVSEYGIDYVAQCCGFCNCECPEGCPRIF